MRRLDADSLPFGSGEGRNYDADGTPRSLAAGGGTVTSVGLALPASVFSVSGSPVTTSGTLTGALINQTANTVFAGPTTGGPAVPTFRALVAADLPGGSGDNITVNAAAATDANFNNTTPGAGGGDLNVLWQMSGASPSQISAYVDVSALEPLVTLNNLAGTLGLAKGGTGANLSGGAINNQLIQMNSGGTALQGFSAGTVNYAVVSTGTAPSWAAIVNSVAGTAPIAVSAATGSVTISHNTTAVSPGSYGGAASVGTFTVDATGHLTAAASVAIAIAASQVTSGVFSEARGGTNQSTYATGDMLYASAVNTLSKRTIGSAGNVLTVSGGLPVWAAPAFTGTVTSVGLALPASVFSVSGSPVTTSGTLTGAFVNQTANTVFAGPSTGVPATPAFRALVANDIPGLDASKIVTGTLVEVRGGTNQGSYALGDILYASAVNTLSKLPIGSPGFVLTVSAGIPTWAAAPVTSVSSGGAPITVSPTTGAVVVSHNTTAVTPGAYGAAAQVGTFTVDSTGHLTAAANVAIGIAASQIISGTLAVARGGTNIGSYTVGDLLYASGTTVLSKLAAAASPLALISGGVGAAPAWGQAQTGTIANNAINNSKLRDSGACSVIGRSVNSSGDPADISAGGNGRVLMRRSDVVEFREYGDVSGYHYHDECDSDYKSYWSSGATTGWPVGVVMVWTGYSYTPGPTHPGVMLFGIGGSSSQGAALASASTFQVGGGIMYAEDLVTYNTTYSSVNYWSMWGYSDSASGTVTSTNDGIYFLNDQGNNTGDLTGTTSNWWCITKRGGAITRNNSGVAVVNSSAAAWSSAQRLRIDINAAGTSVVFSINGSTVATHTTNIPLSTTTLKAKIAVEKTQASGAIYSYHDYTIIGGEITLTGGER